MNLQTAPAGKYYRKRQQFLLAFAYVMLYNEIEKTELE
jgi:hypothetical protein